MLVLLWLPWVQNVQQKLKKMHKLSAASSAKIQKRKGETQLKSQKTTQKADAFKVSTKQNTQGSAGIDWKNRDAQR